MLDDSDCTGAWTPYTVYTQTNQQISMYTISLPFYLKPLTFADGVLFADCIQVDRYGSCLTVVAGDIWTMVGAN